MSYSAPPPPADCLTMEQHEREATAIANATQARGLEMLDRAGGDRIVMATAKELLLASVRARKIAAELAHARETREHADWLVGEYQKINGYSERPKLKLKRRTTP